MNELSIRIYAYIVHITWNSSIQSTHSHTHARSIYVYVCIFKQSASNELNVRVRDKCINIYYQPNKYKVFVPTMTTAGAALYVAVWFSSFPSLSLSTSVLRLPQQIFIRLEQLINHIAFFLHLCCTSFSLSLSPCTQLLYHFSFVSDESKIFPNNRFPAENDQNDTVDA